MKHTAVLIGAFITSMTFGCSQSRNTGDVYGRALRELAPRDFSAAPERVDRKRAAIAAVWHRGRGNTSGIIPYLLVHFHEHQDQQVQKDALVTACSIATPRDVPLITWEVRRKLDEMIIAQANADESQREQLTRHTTLMSNFFVHICIPMLPNEGENLPSLVELLTHFETLAEQDCGVREIPISVMHRILPANETRSLRLVQHIRQVEENQKYGNQWGNLNVVRPYLNNTVRSGLRTVVRESMEEGRAFNLLAAGILAHWGDTEMLPIFKQLQQQQEPDFAAAQIRMIEFQNPPEGLLSHIRGDELLPGSKHWGSWACQRALEIGLPREDILEAIEHYCSLDIDTPQWRVNAMLLKADAVQRGLIKTTDIPTLPYYSEYAITPVQANKQTKMMLWMLNGPHDSPPPDCDYIPSESLKFRKTIETYYPPEIDVPFG